MASTTVYDATKSELQSQFSPPYPVLDFDEIDQAVIEGTLPKAPFIALEEITQVEELAAFGDSQNLCQREEGVLIAHFFTPAPEASSQARSLAEQIQDHMRHRTYSGVRITSVSPPDLEMLSNGLWTSAAIALNYRHDFHVAIPT